MCTLCTRGQMYRGSSTTGAMDTRGVGRYEIVMGLSHHRKVVGHVPQAPHMVTPLLLLPSIFLQLAGALHTSLSGPKMLIISNSPEKCYKCYVLTPWKFFCTCPMKTVVLSLSLQGKLFKNVNFLHSRFSILHLCISPRIFWTTGDWFLSKKSNNCSFYLQAVAKVLWVNLKKTFFTAQRNDEWNGGYRSSSWKSSKIWNCRSFPRS